jgi:hypothetical protein
MSALIVPDPDCQDGHRELHCGAIVTAGLGWGLFVCVECGCIIRLQSIVRHCSWPYLYLGTTTPAWPPVHAFAYRTL